MDFFHNHQKCKLLFGRYEGCLNMQFFCLIQSLEIEKMKEILSQPEFIISIISTFISQTLLILVAYLISEFFLSLHRGKFYKFFGIKKSRYAQIYLSNLYNENFSFPAQKKSINASCEERSPSFISGKEFVLYERLYNFFTRDISIVKSVLRHYSPSLSVKRPVNVNISPSPIPYCGFGNYDLLFIIGSSVNNSARSHYVKNTSPILIFENEDIQTPNSGTKVIKNKILNMHKNQKNIVPPLITDGEYALAIIEKNYAIVEGGDNIFMCSGFDGRTTTLATEYLLENWKKYFKKYGTKPFSLCLAFNKNVSKQCKNDLYQPKVIWETPIK